MATPARHCSSRTSTPSALPRFAPSSSSRRAAEEHAGRPRRVPRRGRTDMDALSHTIMGRSLRRGLGRPGGVLAPGRTTSSSTTSGARSTARRRAAAWVPSRGHGPALPARPPAVRRGGLRRDRRAAPARPRAGTTCARLPRRQERRTEPLSDLEVREHLTTGYIAGHVTVQRPWRGLWHARSPNIRRTPRRCRRSWPRSSTGAPRPGRSAAAALHGDGRQRSPAPLSAARRCRRAAPVVDDEIRGHRFPKARDCSSSSYVTHRHPDYWERPEDFDPERFSEARSAGRPSTRSLVPFTLGPRQCLGSTSPRWSSS